MSLALKAYLYKLELFVLILVEDITLCSKYKNKIHMYSVDEYNNVFIALVATRFGRHEHHLVSATKNFEKDRLHVVHKNVEFCRLPFTSPSIVG
jgi:hypothetical protein